MAKIIIMNAMKLKIASIEDSLSDRQAFTKCLEEIENATSSTFVVDYFSSGEEFLACNPFDYQIVFLDIELPKMNGMETARAFRKFNTSSLLIFLTNYTQYAVDGYEVDAFDYILKPINYYSFYMKFQRILNKLSVLKNKKIEIHNEQGTTYINTNDIRYIEIMGHNMIILTNTKTISTTGVLNTYEKELRAYGFARSSSSTLINLSYIQGIYSDEVYLKTGEKIHLGRTKKKQFLNDVATFMGKGVLE